LDAAPGLEEMVLLGYALQAVEQETDHTTDIVVLSLNEASRAFHRSFMPRC
jgi:hypothetical protein